MSLSTEIFVMIVFLIGFPLFIGVLRGTDLPGGQFFILAYIFFVLSNISTVLEEFCLNSFFNIIEHSTITISAIMIFIAVWKFTSSDEIKESATISKSNKRPSVRGH